MYPLNYFLFLQIILFLFITPGTPRIVIISYSMNYGVQKCVWTALGDVTANIIQATLVTSLATFSSRFLGVVSSEGIKETSKLFNWFNCLAYSTLAALIARTIIFPVGVLSEASYISRAVVVLFCLIIFFISKRNFVYPTVISAIMMAVLSEYL